MSLLANLRATNCNFVDVIGKQAIAVYGPRSLYLYSAEGKRLETMTVPRDATKFAVWRSLTSGFNLLYAVATEDGFALLNTPDGGTTVHDVTLKNRVAGQLESLTIANEFYLLVQTGDSLSVYDLRLLSEGEALAPTAEIKIPRAGEVRLFSSGLHEVAVVVFSKGVVDVYVVGLSSPVSQVTVSSKASGIPLPALNGTAYEVVSCAVAWTRRSLLIVFRSDDAKCAYELSFQTLSWSAPESNLVSELLTKEDAVSCKDGSLWSVEKSADQSVLLRDVLTGTAFSLPQLSSSAKMYVAKAENSVVVLVGKSLYRAEPAQPPTLASLFKTTPDGAANPPKEASCVVELVLEKGKSAVDFVPRDAQYVHQSKPDDRWQHSVLDSIEGHPKAVLRYVAVAHSFHPLTILRVLRQGDRGLSLALATILSKKCASTNEQFYRSMQQFAGPFCQAYLPSTKDRFAYLSRLCEEAVSGVVVGSLQATCFFVFRGGCVSFLPVPHQRGARLRSFGGEERKLVEGIVARVALLSSYADWSATCSTKIGILSAHIGAPNTQKKEAMLSDGKSHPIEVSRRIEIEPLKIKRSPFA
ncbi:hypothetical protein AGDE_13816 [Angomonas deanei]|nr:hypothetical protein AGDE_13816 [Angomonas deanei]|eukprot:EPY21697.1 hypothetical protein AGDE_13816 [Angomonas deanei]